MTKQARGSFDVNLSPQKQTDELDALNLGRMTIDKKYYGDLEAVGKGQMLTARTGVEGSAGYVAIEHVAGKLRGLDGTFILQHNGTMTGNTQQLTITVVPDSGAGQLTGLSGTMEINISENKHFYKFDYTLPD